MTLWKFSHLIFWGLLGVLSHIPIEAHWKPNERIDRQGDWKESQLEGGSGGTEEKLGSLKRSKSVLDESWVHIVESSPFDNSRRLSSEGDDDDPQCGHNHTSLFYLQLKTDKYPWETKWNVHDIFSGIAVLVGDSYAEKHTLSEVMRCLESNSCYQFTIYDSERYADGICCAYGQGYYKVEYDNELIQEGGNFGSSETSIPFGYGCPSSQPSISNVPTTSQRPSSSSKPSSQPSLSIQPSSSPSNGCDANESLFRVEVKTDIIPSETSWDLMMTTINGAKTTVINEKEFQAVDTLHNFRKCLESNMCYQFTIYDSDGNGLNDFFKEKKGERGWYRVDFDGQLIQEGEGDFGFNETSMLFGYGCQSPSPSLSLLPSASPSMSKMPSIEPSLIPSSSLKPSFSPTLSSIPSQSSHPTAPSTKLKETISYSYDGLNRRLFPPSLLLDSSKNSVSYHTLPNCSSTSETEESRVGCVTIPSSSNLQSRPSWAGTLHSGVPPICRRGACDLQVPMSNNFLKFNVTSKILDGLNFQLKPTKKPRPTFGDVSSRSIIGADVNLDRWPDLIIGNYGQPNQLFMNQGHGVYEEVFGALTTNDDSTATNVIAIGDVNSDGFPDLVVGNFREHNTLLLNQGDGTFKEAIGAIPGNNITQTTAIAVADFDGDGLLDLIVGNYGQPDELLLNIGDGSFFRSFITGATPQVATLTQTVAVADVNADGLVDILIGNELQINQLLLNKGNGLFEEVIGALSNESFNTSVIIVADVDGDQLVDLIIGNYGVEEPNQLLLNQGDGSFKEAASAFPSEKLNTQSIAVADLDGDGLLDVLIGTEMDQPNRMLLNQGDSSFKTVATGAIPGLPTSLDGDEQDYPSTLSIAVSDVDADGRVDMFIGNHDNPNQVLLNKESFGYIPVDVSSAFADESDTWDVAVADLNGDGLPDLVIANREQPNQVLLSKGDGSFEEIFSDVSNDEKKKTHAISIGDLNGDGLPDLVIGNYEGPNQVMFNTGDGHFEESDLAIPGGESSTEALVLVDIDADGDLDILVGNYNREPNQLMLNQGDGTFQEVINAIPGEYETKAIAVADVNNDGFIDIIIGNEFTSNQLLLNRGNGTFQDIENAIPEQFKTFSIAVADVNADGLIDIIVGNIILDRNQLLLNKGDGTFEEIYDALPNSDTNKIVVADFDGDSFPDLFVGNYGGPNHLFINQGDGTFEKVLEDLLPKEPSQTKAVAVGDFNADGRIDFVVGTRFVDNQLFLFSTCPNGGAPLHGSSWCFPCPKFMGRPQFQNFEASMCRECDPDHIQDESTGLCSNEPCSLQTRKLGGNVCQDCQDGYYYNSSTIVRSEDRPYSFLQERCVPCGQGTYFSKELHGRAIDQCSPCVPGTYASNTGSVHCAECDPGTFQASFGQSSCGLCPERTFSKESGAVKCDICPARLSSLNNSATCSYCSDGYLLNQTFRGGLLEVSPGLNQSTSSFKYFYSDESSYQYKDLSYFNYSTKISFYTYFDGEEFIYESEGSCLFCPPNADCSFNTTLETLGVSPNYWRDSEDTTMLYFCGENERCTGNLENTSSNNYCKDGYHGPLCKLCNEDRQYFSESEGTCLKCPSLSLISLKATSILLGIFCFVIVAYFILKRVPSLRTGVQTKIKILVSFYQVAATFQSVYGMRLDESVAKIMTFFSYLTFGVFDLIPIPADCIGSKKEQLLLILLCPLCFLLLVGGVFFCIQASLSRNQNIEDDIRSSIRSRKSKSRFLTLSQFDFKMRYINIIIITFYLVLPGVSNNIFSIIQCRHFSTSDETGAYRSYLMDDLSIQCDKNEPTYYQLLVIFWVSVLLWLFLVLICWSLLLTRIWHPVRSNQITPLARACRFLWRDYEPSVMFWDIFDMTRKIFLTGVIACIDMNSSTEIFRLIIAGVISLIYLVILTMSRPYKRAEDQYLAVISNVMLICCFFMGIVLNICDDGDCIDVIGLGPFTASVIVIVLTLVTLMLTVGSVAAVVYVTISHSILTLNSGEKPNFILDDVASNCEYHAFFSHVWETGQAKSHAIVRKMQLVMPDVRIWLDVDHIHQSSGYLEEAVEMSVVLILFYSEGYFNSRNCRREIDAALRLGKPVIVIYEGGESILESMREECSQNDENNVLKNIFEQGQDHFILWVNEDIFAAKSLNSICSMVLKHLPYYQRHPHELVVGVHVPGELGKVTLTSPVTAIVCRANRGSFEAICEAKDVLKLCEAPLLSISDPIANAEELEALNENSPLTNKPIMILYLNENIFEEDEEELTILLKCAINLDLKIILLHELDLQRGGGRFGDFFKKTPKDLLLSPYEIYSNNIAVPLYGNAEYRELGLKRVLLKLGANEARKSKVGNSLLRKFYSSQRR